jgi:hypothetical protein
LGLWDGAVVVDEHPSVVLQLQLHMASQRGVTSGETPSGCAGSDGISGIERGDSVLSRLRRPVLPGVLGEPLLTEPQEEGLASTVAAEPYVASQRGVISGESPDGPSGCGGSDGISGIERGDSVLSRLRRPALPGVLGEPRPPERRAERGAEGPALRGGGNASACGVGPSRLISTGRWLLSSFMRLEFWKWEMRERRD